MADIDSDPFVEGLFGGSPKTEITASATFTGGTTARANPSGEATSSSGRATRSSFGLDKATLRLHGATRDIGLTGKKASSARSFGTKAQRSRRSLSDRLTLSLISAGLVCGITPLSTRQQSGQPIQVLAFDMPGGAAAEHRQAGCSSSSVSERAAA